LKLLVKRSYSVKSNQETGNGRSDILIQEYLKRNLVIIIEVKDAAEFSRLDMKCDEALQQIEDRQYAVELLKDGNNQMCEPGRVSRLLYILFAFSCFLNLIKITTRK